MQAGAAADIEKGKALERIKSKKTRKMASGPLDHLVTEILSYVFGPILAKAVTQVMGFTWDGHLAIQTFVEN
jgi:hypothetical protein